MLSSSCISWSSVISMASSSLSVPSSPSETGGKSAGSWCAWRNLSSKSSARHAILDDREVVDAIVEHTDPLSTSEPSSETLLLGMLLVRMNYNTLEIKIVVEMCQAYL